MVLEVMLVMVVAEVLVGWFLRLLLNGSGGC